MLPSIQSEVRQQYFKQVLEILGILVISQCLLPVVLLAVAWRVQVVLMEEAAVVVNFSVLLISHSKFKLSVAWIEERNPTS